ncbi:hypothetical protein D3C78_1575740 [compost metagenome]
MATGASSTSRVRSSKSGIYVSQNPAWARSSCSNWMAKRPFSIRTLVLAISSLVRDISVYSVNMASMIRRPTVEATINSTRLNPA